ncbi:MAG: RlmF-related methyltransferase, partial [Planctomycetota bacterium JB042]
HREKLRGLGAATSSADAPRRNFGGRDAELWCEGGERGFLRRMIEQSAAFADRCGWFTSLVSRKESLRPAERALARVRPAEVRTLPLSHGRKTTRILAWRFEA